MPGYFIVKHIIRLALVHSHLNQPLHYSSVQCSGTSVIHLGADHHAIVLGRELGDARIEPRVVGLGVADEYGE